MENNLRYLGETSGGSNTTSTTQNLSYDIGLISIFLLLVFYVISNGIISKYHVK